MPKPAAAAVSQQLRLQCLQRLQHLQTQFLHIDSPAELADVEQEGGHILALLLHGKHIEPDSLVTNARDILLDYAAGALNTTASNGRPFDDGLALHFQRSLWNLVAMVGSDQQRILLHNVGPAPTWTVAVTRGSKTIQQRLDTGVQLKATDRAKDYKQQGKRYGLLASELIAKLSTDQTTSSPPTTSSDSIEKRPFTEGELVDALNKLLHKASQYYTAGQVHQHLMARYPDKTVGETAIKNHPIWKQHAKDWGKDRAPRNTSRQAEKAICDKLIAQQKRREQQTSYRGVDRIADGD